MTEYFVRQFDGGQVACDGRNCAAASGATAVAFGSAGKHTPTADEFRKRSGRSCVPGADSPSGGLFISDVERVASSYGVSIDYGREAGGGLKRWTAAEIKSRVMGDFGAVLLGDYDQVPASLDRQPGFNGDHSVFIHDGTTSTACWHDPLGTAPVRVAWSVIAAYNQKAGSPVKGLAGFVRIPVPRPPDTSTEDIVKVYSVPALFSGSWPAGTPVYPGPTGAATGKFATARDELLVVGQDKPTSPTRYLVDGAGDGPSGGMSWLPVAGMTGKRAETFNAGVTAAAKAATAAKR